MKSLTAKTAEMSVAQQAGCGLNLPQSRSHIILSVGVCVRG